MEAQKTVDDGGPAFPQPIAGCNDGSVYETREKSIDGGGMTKRELFAAMAMQGCIGFNGGHAETMAERSVQYADALLAELAKEVE